jgi:hypothetical protein
MRILSVAWVLLPGLILTGCAGATSSSPATGPTVAASSGSAASLPSSSASGGPRYTTVKFAVPLSVSVAPVLIPTPTDETPGLLSWTAIGNANNKVRFLVPAEVYPPNAAHASPPPKDFLGYIKGLADRGAVYGDMSTKSVDGVQATLVTAKATQSLDGSLGCPTIGADRSQDCFGLQPDFALRIAVLDVSGKPLLVWARTDVQSPDAAFIAAFEDMLATVAFK